MYVAELLPSVVIVPKLADHVTEAATGRFFNDVSLASKAFNSRRELEPAVDSKFWGWISIRAMHGSMAGTFMFNPLPGRIGMAALSELKFATGITFKTCVVQL